MILEADGCDWDDGNRTKCRKHGVSTAEVEEVFRGGSLVARDLSHSRTEDRLIAIGGPAWKVCICGVYAAN